MWWERQIRSPLEGLPGCLYIPIERVDMLLDMRVLVEVWQSIHRQNHRVQNSWNLVVLQQESMSKSSALLIVYLDKLQLKAANILFSETACSKTRLSLKALGGFIISVKSPLYKRLGA